MTTAEKLARLNELRAANGKEPLKAWKQSGAKLDEALVAESPLEDDFDAPRGLTMEDHGAIMKDYKEMAAGDDQPGFSEEEIMEKAEENERQEAAKAKPAKKAKGDTIRSYAEQLLRDEPGLKHKEIADKVRKRFKDASTSAASVAWYASKMKKRSK